MPKITRMNRVLLTCVLALCGLGASIPSWAMCQFAPRACCAVGGEKAASKPVRSCCQTARPVSQAPGYSQHSPSCRCELEPTAPSKESVSVNLDLASASIDHPVAARTPLAGLESIDSQTAAVAPSLQVLYCVWRC
jgi:hypothetical protein